MRPWLWANTARRKEFEQRFSLANSDSAFVIEQKRINGRSTDWSEPGDAVAFPANEVLRRAQAITVH